MVGWGLDLMSPLKLHIIPTLWGYNLVLSLSPREALKNITQAHKYNTHHSCSGMVQNFTTSVLPFFPSRWVLHPPTMKSCSLMWNSPHCWLLLQITGDDSGFEKLMCSRVLNKSPQQLAPEKKVGVLLWFVLISRTKTVRKTFCSDVLRMATQCIRLHLK